MFVFDRLQVVADTMEGWDFGGAASFGGSCYKKRRFEMFSPDGEASKRRAPASDEEIDDL